MGEPAYVLQAGLWLVGSGWALGVGRGPASVAALLLILQLVVEYVDWIFSHGVSSRAAAYAADAALAGFFIWAAWRHRLRWASAAAGGQLMSMALHFVRPLMPQVGTWAFVTALDVFGFVVLGAVMVGCWNSRRRTG